MRKNLCPSWIFFGKVRIRTGWRILIFFFIVVSLFLILSRLFLFMGTHREKEWEHLWDSIASYPFVLLFLFVVLFSSFIMVRFFDKRSFASLGLSFDPGWLKEILYGLLGGFLLTGFLFMTGILLNSYHISLTLIDFSSFLRSFAKYFFLLLIFATLEEILFRGYAFQTLIEGIGETLSILLLSIIFGLAHSFNPNSNGIGIINTALAGAFLSIIYIQKRSLWLPIFIHFSWNFSIGYLFALPISGLTCDGTLWRTEMSGAEILSGGRFGLEGSLLTTILLSIMIVLLMRMEFLKPSEKMKKRWEAYDGKGKNRCPFDDR